MLLDTDIFVDTVRRHPPALSWFAMLTQTPKTSGYSAIELVSGCEDKAEVRRARRFRSGFRILWPDENHLNEALNIYAPLTIAHGIGVQDILVAATALSHALPLATFNTRHFRAISELTIVTPYER